MPQDRESGARANKFGRETAKAIADKIGAIPISKISNEFSLKNRKVTIRCAHHKTTSVGMSYKMKERIDDVILAHEQQNGEYKLYKISSDKYEQSMNPTKSKGPSAGKVGMVKISVFIEEGDFIETVNL